MARFNAMRKGCKDVFNAFLVTAAQYAGFLEFPVIHPTYWIPNRLITFSKALSCKDHNQWIHFYEDDWQFERVWRNPRKYLPVFQRFNGVILPDFSLYRDMPLVMQLWNIYRSRAIGHWLQNHGVKVIVNIRFADARTFRLCCSGISRHITIAIGTHGNVKNRQDREILINGIYIIIKELKPKAIVFYGTVPKNIYDVCDFYNVKVYRFDSDCASSHKEVA